ncbi:MAG TPA: lytic transglycosylase domain-containing protein [Pyrinomonadaceae bacterium]|nr:lytic transglycosylase domain-containing protein [Pyrinomonadaceae bacterium]
MRKILAAVLITLALAPAAGADVLRLKDGTSIEADEVWDDPEGVWYRRGGVTYHVERTLVEKIERARAGATEAARPRVQSTRLVEAGASHHAPSAAPAVRSSEIDAVEGVKGIKLAAPATEPITIHLVGGASFEVDEANESADGVWYRRGNLSIFIERARIERIERGRVETEGEVAKAGGAARRERRWGTGSLRLDQLIRQNGARHGVDPYLIFLVMEQESHFNSRAVSPAGARGLMQLMPGTAARFGVRNPHDPAQSVSAGARYLRQLIKKFNGRVDLALAGYNAGEGNVMKYGYRVPPFRETRNYVRKISGRYHRP